MQEIWKDILEYEGLYQISNLGRVKSLPRKGVFKQEKILKLERTKKGYLRINLSKNNVSKKYLVHKLVANSFISNPYNFPQVNHKDGNKQNNFVDNLEFVTQEQNMQHAFNKGLIQRKKGKENLKSKKVNQYDLNGKFIKLWYCIRDIERELGLKNYNITACCQNRRKTCGGYIWKYEKGGKNYDSNES